MCCIAFNTVVHLFKSGFEFVPFGGNCLMALIYFYTRFIFLLIFILYDCINYMYIVVLNVIHYVF